MKRAREGECAPLVELGQMHAKLAQLKREFKRQKHEGVQVGTICLPRLLLTCCVSQAHFSANRQFINRAARLRLLARDALKIDRLVSTELFFPSSVALQDKDAYKNLKKAGPPFKSLKPRPFSRTGNIGATGSSVTKVTFTDKSKSSNSVSMVPIRLPGPF
jgi:hypothetical protein